MDQNYNVELKNAFHTLITIKYYEIIKKKSYLSFQIGCLSCDKTKTNICTISHSSCDESLLNKVSVLSQMYTYIYIYVADKTRIQSNLGFN